jgi:tape measure domain-containing protein
MAESLGTAVLRLFADDSALRAGLGRAQQAAAQAGASIRGAVAGAGGGIKANAFTALESGLGALPGAAGQAGSAIASIAGGLGGLGGAGIVVAGVAAGMVALGGAAVGTANELQRTINQLTVLTGSAAATSAVIANLKQYALETPFDLPGLAATAKQLLAFGLNGADAVEWTKRLGDIATVTGTPIERLGINFSQIVSKGGASMVDLTQFAQAGLPIWSALSEVTGKSRAELEALDGAIPASAVVAALESMTDAGGKFYEGGKKGATELDTQWASLVDGLKAAAVPLGQMITPLVLSGINNMISALQIMEAGLNRIRDAAAAVAASGIGQLIGKAVNFATGGFLGNVAQAVVGPPAPPPPIPNTGPSLKDTLQKAEAERALAEAKERGAKAADAQIKAQGTIGDAQAKYALLSQTGLLEGLALERAKQRLAIEEKQAEVKRAAAAYDQALIGAGFKQDDPKVIQAKAALDAAGINLQTAMLAGADAIAKASREAAQNLKGAYESLLNARQSAFDLLPDARQRDLVNLAGGRVNEQIKAGEFDLGRVIDALPGAFEEAYNRVNVDNVDPAKLFEIAGKAQGIQEATNKVNEAVAAATTDLATQVRALLEKSWQVNLAVAPGGKVEAAGDVLGGVA